MGTMNDDNRVAMKTAAASCGVALVAMSCITPPAAAPAAPPPVAAVAAPEPAAPVALGPHGLPIPPAATPDQPGGSPADLTILDWAGFRGAVSWTFDDAQPSQIEHYAELAAERVPMTFYISTANHGEKRFDETWAQAVKDGHEIGNHAVHHCRADLGGCLSGAPVASLAAELDACTDYLRQHFPQAGVWTMAAPFGDSGYAPLAASRFLVNRGIGAGQIAPGDDTDPFALPCYIANEGDTAAVFNRQTRWARNGGRWLIFLVHTVTPTEARWFAPVAIGDVTAGMRYGRALGDVWMGTVVDVAAYWLGQKILKAASPSVAGGVTTWRWELPRTFPPGKYLRVRVSGGTLSQGGVALAWDEHGYYEIALDAKELTLSR
jgi:peptidoglycan/xylan/chitin deacetylase (PgdA/CDA1 family)